MAMADPKILERTAFDPVKPPKKNKYAFGCAVLASMTSILLGYDIGVMSGASIYIKDDLKVSDVQIEILIGILNLYSLVGSAAAGKTSDWIGRRYTIVFAAAIFFVGALLMGFATNYSFLMVGRFVAGIGVGYALMIAPVYTAEVSPASSRGFLTSFPEVFINAGYIDLNNPPEEETGDNTINVYTTNRDFDLNKDLQDDNNTYSSRNQDSTQHFTSENEMGGEEHLAEEREAKKIRILSNDQRREIYLALLKKSVDGKLKKDTSRSVASLFSVSMRTVQRIWKQAKNSLNACGVVDVSHRKTKNCGRKRIQIDVEKFKSIPLNQRTTLESTACALSIGKTTLHRNLQEGRIKRHTNPLRPYLKDDNKKARLQFCISMLEENGIHHDPIFSSLENTVFIDEKWFNMTKKSETYYLLGDEEEPHRTCKSKNFVEKIMFLAAIARPRFDEDGNVTFDGKIGIFPFVTKEPAKRTSVNRVAGTLETKAMTSIGRDINRSFLTQKVIPAILAKWPPEDFGKTIVIQQDNARTHIDPNDEVFRECVSRQNFDIQLKCQPPNSPDLNILDLGFFNAIQSLKHKEAPKTVDDLVRAVENAFENFSPIKSNRIFLTLQQCMVEIMKVGGSNRYKIPHMSKAALERQGQLPRQIKCDKKLVEDVLSVL